MTATPALSGPDVRRRLFGPNSDESLAKGAAAELVPDFNEFVDEHIFGGVWNDQRLELRYRSLVTISALVVLGREAQLRGHVAAGIRLGLTRQEILGAVTHLAFYAGLPATYSALETVRQAFGDIDASGGHGGSR
jgi:4-carboxymuconolactone decarboxylase